MYDATVIGSLLLTSWGAYCFHLQSRFRQITIEHGVISQKTGWYCVGFEVLTALIMKIVVWDVTLGSLVGNAFRWRDPAAFIYATGSCLLNIRQRLTSIIPGTQVVISSGVARCFDPLREYAQWPHPNRNRDLKNCQSLNFLWFGSII